MGGKEHRIWVDRAKRRATRWRNQQHIASLARQVEEHSPRIDETAARRVLMFNATARLGTFTLNASFSLLLGWALRLQGVRVERFICQAGMTHCVLGTNWADLTQPPPCSACIAQSKRLAAGTRPVWFVYQEERELASAIQSLSTTELSAVEYPAAFLPGTPSMPLGRMAIASARWALRRHNLPDDLPTRRLLGEYLLSQYSTARKFAACLEQLKPSLLVTFNGSFYPEAAVRWVARQVGMPSIAYEVGFRPFSFFLTDGEPTAYPIHIPPDFELDPQQEEQLDALLEKRFQGKFTMAGIRFWPEMRGLDQEFLAHADNFRQVVPIFTNVVYDTSQAHANTIFDNMFSWLELLLEIIRSHPETLFVIRAHPDEKRPVSNKISNESVHDWVMQNGVNQLANVIFIEPDEFISSYELIQRSKFVLVYNSSIGLEATLLGAPVICGGKARYTQYPTVFLPASPPGLRSQVESFLAADRIEIPDEFQRNARRFLYYQFFRVSLPFDKYLQEGEAQGQVYLKSFSWQDLLPENSSTLRIILDGILNGPADFYQ